MNMQRELIIHFDKKSGRLMLILLPILFTFMFEFVLVPINSLLTAMNRSYFFCVILLLEIIIAFFLAILVYTYFFLLTQMKDKQPVAILNKQGIWIKWHGTIPWKHIEVVGPYLEIIPQKVQEAGIIVGIKIKKKFTTFSTQTILSRR